MRKEVALNSNWFYSNEFLAEYIKTSSIPDGLEEVNLPHGEGMDSTQYFDEKRLSKVSAYFRYLEIDKKYSGSRIILKFGGVLSYAEIYVNGVFITSHKGETPFDADISVHIKYDEPNIILVKADSTLRLDVPSQGKSSAMLEFSGIYRDVILELNKGELIRDIFVTCGNINNTEKDVRIDVTLYSFYPDTTLKAEILDEDNNAVGTISPKDVLRPITLLKGVISNVELWELEKPVLYSAKITLEHNGKILDERLVKFGFRSVNFTRSGFELNGRRVKLIGLNRVDSFPLCGRAVPSLLQRKDARIIKYELGLNVVRTLGLASTDFIDECDKIGLMVISDLSGEARLNNMQWRESILNVVTETVLAYRNNPSVIAWGVRLNNSADCDELYFKTNKTAHDLDGTRQTFGVRSFMESRLYEDVFAYNDYGRSGVSRRTKTSRLFVPYILSEHTGISVAPADSEKDKLRAAMRHLKVIDKVLARDNICGAIGTSFSDFNCANHKSSGDNINYSGVTDIYRCPKLSAYAYASQFSSKAVLELSSTLAPNSFSGKLYAFTNCDYIKVYRYGKEIGHYEPNSSRFKALPHPPIEIKDIYGSTQILEGFKKGEARVFKYLQKRLKNKDILSLNRIDKLVLFILSKSLKTDIATLGELFKKYSLKADTFSPLTVEGYKDGVCVIKRLTGTQTPLKVEVFADDDTDRVLCTKGYELIKINVAVKSEQGNILDKCFEPARIKAEGAFKIECNELISLIAGQCSFYVRAIKDGKGLLSVECLGQKQSIELEAEYERVERF